MTAAPQWVDRKGAAEHSGYSVDTIGDALNSGDLRGYRRGKRGRWRINVDDIDAWLRGEKPAETFKPQLVRAG